jgi:D-alanyl-D-alanine carboxypeptidase
MKSRITSWGSIILICTFTLSCEDANVVPTNGCNYTPLPSVAHPKSQVFQSILDTYVNKGLPGVSALVRDEDGVWMGYAGKADMKKNIPFTPCHPSKAASITKFMVATLTFMLQERGLINIDDPISKYIDTDIPPGLTMLIR